MIIEPSIIVILTILFLVALVVKWWAQMRMGFYVKKGSKANDRKRAKERAKEKHRPEYYLNYAISNIVIPMFFVTMICITYAYARLHLPMDKYTYIDNGLATQKDTDVLFFEDIVNTEEKERKEECNNKLHIPERFIGKRINAEMYDFFLESLPAVYTNGTKDGYSPAPVIESGDTLYDSLENSNIQRAKYYRTAYNNSPNQACLYQYGRELSEFEPKESNFPFEWMFAIMSESMWSLESFLQYADRNVGDNDTSVVIDAYWVAFIEGKMFLRNGKLAVSSEEGADYSDCFLAEAFVSFEISQSKLSPRNGDYVKISYYIGVSGESLLNRIDKESNLGLYSRIGSKAMSGYQEAKKYYEAAPDFYSTEPGMLDNIKAGINTLVGLGIPEE